MTHRVFRPLLILALILAGCTTAPAPAPTATSAPTVAAAPTAAPATTAVAINDDQTTLPAPTAGASKTVVIGSTQPPDTLYGLESSSLTSAGILALLGGQSLGYSCYTARQYRYQPTCFEQFPSFAAGTVVTTTVFPDGLTVDANHALVVDGEPLTSTLGVTVPERLEQTAVTWTLKADLRWQDGAPLTADDFLLGYELAKNPATALASRWLLDRTWSMRAVDAHTLTWLGAPGYRDATPFLNFFPPLPAHILRAADPATLGSGDYAQRPLSFGPYQISEYIPSDSLTLVANPAFSGPAPKIDTVIYRFVADEDQLLAQLESGDIDYANSTSLALTDLERLQRLEADGKVVTLYSPTPTWEHLDFGLQRPDGQPGLFADGRLRQAVAYALDRPALIAAAQGGKAAAMQSFVPSDHWAYPPNGAGLTLYPHDADRAAALLRAAGYAPGPDGMLLRDGQALTVTLYTTEKNVTRQLVAELIQQQLKAVGIAVDIAYVPGVGKLFKADSDGILPAHNFDLALYASSAEAEPDTTAYQCGHIPSPANEYQGANVTAYCSAAFDALAQAAVATPDAGPRAALLAQAQALWTADLPTLPLYQRVKVAARSPRLSGPQPDPTQLWDTDNLAEWDVAP